MIIVEDNEKLISKVAYALTDMAFWCLNIGRIPFLCRMDAPSLPTCTSFAKATFASILSLLPPLHFVCGESAWILRGVTRLLDCCGARRLNFGGHFINILASIFLLNAGMVKRWTHNLCLLWRQHMKPTLLSSSNPLRWIALLVRDRILPSLLRFRTSASVPCLPLSC